MKPYRWMALVLVAAFLGGCAGTGEQVNPIPVGQTIDMAKTKYKQVEASGQVCVQA